MSPVGPEAFASQPLLGEPYVIDGLRLTAALPIQKVPFSVGTNVIGGAQGNFATQSVFVQQKSSQNPQFYQFSVAHQLDEEAEFRKWEGVQGLGRAVWFIPYMVETEVFVLVAGANLKILRRYVAEAAFPSFETSLYKHVVDIDDTLQTVVSGAPSAGEVQFKNNNEVLTGTGPAAGQIMTVRYYGAYAVLISDLGLSLVEYNNVFRQILMREAATVT